VAKVGPDSFWISGRLTIRGVTREVTLRGRFNAPLADLASAPSVHFELGAEVDREDYGMEWPPTEIGGVIVGQTVTISISAEVRAVADHDAQSGTALAAPRPSVAATGAPVIPFNAAQGDPRI
jgi:hypothetical protein